MVKTKSLGIGEMPLRFSKAITQLVNKEWEDGTFLQKVSSITKDLLRFWDPNGSWRDQRDIQFHEGQWQAILNTIYCHEILKIKNLKELYHQINNDLFTEFLNLVSYEKEKYEHPQYCIKMATGTGKTWVLSALLIWQFLNAKYEEEYSGRFTKNFLIIAPGLIVYERLLDAYLGKRIDNEGKRNFETSDFKNFEELFCPPAYKNEVFGFIQSSVVSKDEIGKKITGEGMIAITNWHLLSGDEMIDEEDLPLDSPEKIIKKILPITPGISAGHSLEELDNQYFRGRELNYLSQLKDLLIFNDEAHHLGDLKISNETIEKRWQKAILKISKNKKENFMQIDFSATPYMVTGSGQKRTKHFFPHIITNFDLRTAIHQGLVKTVAIDKRKELAALPLDFKAERETKGNGVQDLSEGQKVMLRAGLSKLKMLSDGFKEWGKKNKHPKMLVMCEDTKVAPHVYSFLRNEGLSEEEIVEIHSKKSGEILEADKIKLSNLDKSENPKVIISVLMLREGFDVNTICVIVPLRSSTSYILLEQTIGRGLRLMWREKEYEEIKEENRINLLIKKIEPKSYFDILSIIEHPAFIEFYEKELGDAFAKVNELPKKERIVGDLIKVDLKENYQEYDLFWPIIIQDKEEKFEDINLSLENLKEYPIKLKDIKPLIKKGDTFYGEEITVKTRFGEYSVTSDLFNAKSYQQFIQKIVNAVSSVQTKRDDKRKSQVFPIMQINTFKIAKLVDEYIRHKLFGENFDPLKDNNWKFLILTEEKLRRHIITNISQEIYDLQKRLKVLDAIVIKKNFSEIKEIIIRENCAIDVAKTIYPKISFPSNKGGFEKVFMEFIDSDSKVDAFIKINENNYSFANILYIRSDGMLAHYFPDFIIKVGNKIFIVETKAERDLNQEDVLKKRLAACDWCEKINELKPQDRMNCKWEYILLGEKTFYALQRNGANILDIFESPGIKITKAKIKGTLSDFTGDKEY